MEIVEEQEIEEMPALFFFRSSQLKFFQPGKNILQDFADLAISLEVGVVAGTISQS